MWSLCFVRNLLSHDSLNLVIPLVVICLSGGFFFFKCEVFFCGQCFHFTLLSLDLIYIWHTINIQMTLSGYVLPRPSHLVQSIYQTKYWAGPTVHNTRPSLARHSHTYIVSRLRLSPFLRNALGRDTSSGIKDSASTDAQRASGLPTTQL